ncbi:MAG: hypothetical protein WCO33_04690 [bacterium]
MLGINTKPKYKRSFNLLFAQNRQLDSWDRLYVWLSGTCRIIIILALLIILLSFGYRFILERNLNDLKDSLDTVSFRLKSYEKRQSEIAQVQAEIVSYNTVWKQFSNFATNIDDVIALVPKNISDMSFSTSLVGIQLSGTGARSIIAQIENSYKNSPLYINVVLSNLSQSKKNSSSTDEDLTFNLQGNYAKKIQRASLFLSDKTQ